MEILKQAVEQSLDYELKQIVLSSTKISNGISKIKIRPICNKNGLVFQWTSYQGTQVFHSNESAEQTLKHIMSVMEKQFGQIQIQSTSYEVTAMVSKKGKVTLKKHKVAAGIQNDSPLTHNRKKHYILEEGSIVPFLIDLGVMTKEGKIVNAKYDKFRQINRFLEFIEDIVPSLPQEKELTIIDFGCGKSYLTFAMYYYLKIMKQFPIHIIGIDLKKDVIQKCNALRDRYGYETMQFIEGDIGSFTGVQNADMVVTLHACDTATDFALAKAVEWGAAVILSVPCCQHELNKQMHCDMLKPISRYGLLKERMMALVTDGMRAGLLEQQGYETQVLEFIDMEHTPKNILIRAVKKKHVSMHPVKKAENALEECMDFFGVEPTLKRLFETGNNKDMIE